MRTAILILGLPLVLGAAPACRKDEGSQEKRQGGDMSARSADDGEKPVDWPKEKLVLYQGTVDGIAFKVELPEPRLAREEKKGDDTLPGYVTWNAKGNFTLAPSFTVQPDVMFQDSLESLKGGVLMPEQKVTVAEALPGGGYLKVVEEASKRFLEVVVHRKSPAGKWVHYALTTRISAGIPSFEAFKAWAIRVAKTLVLP
jgi:hypothetical protein